MNKRKEKKHNEIYRFLFLVFSCLLFTVYCLLFAACGKKGDPTLKSFEKPDTPSGLRAIHRESEIILLWEFPKDKELPVTWVTGYKVYREINKEEVFKFIGETSTPSFVDKDNPSMKRNYKILLPSKPR